MLESEYKACKSNRKVRTIFLKKIFWYSSLVNSFGNWVRTDCENARGGHRPHDEGAVSLHVAVFSHPDQ